MKRVLTLTNIITVDEDVAGTIPAGAVAQAHPANLFDAANNGNYNVTAILSVQGASVASRTAWIDNGRYTQAAAVSYRSLDAS